MWTKLKSLEKNVSAVAYLSICLCLPQPPINSVDGGEAAIMTQLSNTKPNNVPNVQMCKCAKGYRDANFSLPSLEAEANSVEHDNMVRKCNGYS
jgi:hypothetical protein